MSLLSGGSHIWCFLYPERLSRSQCPNFMPSWTRRVQRISLRQDRVRFRVASEVIKLHRGLQEWSSRSCTCASHIAEHATRSSRYTGSAMRCGEFSKREGLYSLEQPWMWRDTAQYAAVEDILAFLCQECSFVHLVLCYWNLTVRCFRIKNEYVLAPLSVYTLLSMSVIGNVSRIRCLFIVAL